MSPLDLPLASWFSAPDLYLLMCLVPPHCVQLLLSFHALPSCCRKPRCPSPSPAGSGRALPIISAQDPFDPPSLPTSSHCTTPLLALGSCMGCCAAKAGASLCTDSQVAGWFPILPLYPTFPNLNAMFAFTSSFHFPPALVFVALLRLKQSAAYPLKLWLGSEWKGKAQDPKNIIGKLVFVWITYQDSLLNCIKVLKNEFPFKSLAFSCGYRLRTDLEVSQKWSHLACCCYLEWSPKTAFVF